MKMATISVNSNIMTAIDIYSVEPEEQQSLVKKIADFIKRTVKQQSGFISANVHISLDGLRVVNYAQWQSKEDYEAYLSKIKVKFHADKGSQFKLPDSHLYEVYVSVPENFISKIKEDKNVFVFIRIFKVESHHQSRVAELAGEALKTINGSAGLISSYFHRSLDGTRLVNYGQWDSVANFEATLTAMPMGIQLDQILALSQSEYQRSLYQVVFLEPAE
jgi:quinol monooxygenase YgiN